MERLGAIEDHERALTLAPIDWNRKASVKSQIERLPAVSSDPDWRHSRGLSQPRSHASRRKRSATRRRTCSLSSFTV